MNRREKLIDNYEDALFAVLMDKVAEEEGTKLREENQRLQNDPEGVVPEHVDAVARQTIRKAFAGQNRRSAVHVARRVVNAVAMIVLICSALFVTAYAAFPEVRVKTLNLLIQSSDVASRLSLLNEEKLNLHPERNDEDISLFGYSLPLFEEFSLVAQNEDRLGGWIKYQAVTGETVRISITRSKTNYIDIEDVDGIEEITIHGNSGIMTEKNNIVTLTWADSNHDTYITLVCSNLSSTFALQVAEQITYMGF